MVLIGVFSATAFIVRLLVSRARSERRDHDAIERPVLERRVTVVDLAQMRSDHAWRRAGPYDTALTLERRQALRGLWARRCRPRRDQTRGRARSGRVLSCRDSVIIQTDTSKILFVF